MSPVKKKSTHAYRIGSALVIIFIFSLVGLYIGLPSLNEIEYLGANIYYATTTPVIEIKKASHVPTPEIVRGIYMTSCVASVRNLRNSLMKLIDETELNSVVIDIKSFDGHISFMPKDEKLALAAGGCLVNDMEEFLAELHSKNIYVIGRVAAFQDSLQVKFHPELAVKKASATSSIWADYKGITWIDASAKPHWDYLVELAKETYDIGVDEINFDYIRFPSDGNMKDIYYPWSKSESKSEVMRRFYEYLHDELSPLGIPISADIFGMTTTNFDDLNIGQVIEYALTSFDFVSPMVYPSHYPKSFLGLGDPNQHVYTIVKYSMDRAVERALATTTRIFFPDSRIGTSTPAVYAKPSFDKKKLRPWLQDNNYPVPYTAEMVRDQIQAAYDSGLDSWLLWNAGNRYTRAALEAEIVADLQISN